MEWIIKKLWKLESEMRFLKSKNTAILVEIMDTEGIIKNA